MFVGSKTKRHFNRRYFPRTNFYRAYPYPFRRRKIRPSGRGLSWPEIARRNGRTRAAYPRSNPWKRDDTTRRFPQIRRLRTFPSRRGLRDKQVRLACLLHDIGKPLCSLRDGNSYAHPKEGAALAKAVLQRFKAPKKDIQRIPALVEWHMYDLDCKTSEKKLRRFFVAHLDILEELLLVKQADFSACMDDFSIAPTVKRWEDLLDKMKAEGAPLRIKDLALTGKDILDLGITESKIATVLNALLTHAAVNPTDNNKQRLSTLALGFAKTL